ncbi:MAG: potassium/hydrogen antiporter [Solirubrobacteraceae bacterium]|jgi:cell volume regulation protein A|nr:potassium/hydrogen antiporter [Solirubrobacteraceae bacterium]
MHDGQLILAAGALLGAGLLASLLAGRMRVPSLVLFLGVGMAVGSDGVGWIDFGDYELARTIGVVALALILFEGGLTSGLLEIRPVLRAAIALAVIGTLVTAAVTGLVAAWLFDLSTLEGLLLGAVLASTDGAAIFGLLRGSTLERKLARTLEAESGLNDPVAVLLVLGFIEWIRRPDYGVVDMLGLLVQQLGIGVVVGGLVGVGAVAVLRRVRLDSPGLYPVASLAAAALAFGGADTLHGSGFLAVYLTGLALGTSGIPAQRTVTTFHQGLAWVAQVVLFLTLGLLVFPSALGSIALQGTVLALVVVLVARPVAVWLSTVRGYTAAERVILSVAGLRGAVPVVLATFPVIAGVQGSGELFNIVFFAVLISTVVQGASFEPLAERLGVTTREPALPTPLAEAGTVRALGAEVLEFPIGSGDAIAGASVRDLGLPREAVVNVIVRDNQAIPPRGSTRLQAGDHLHLLIRQEMTGLIPGLLRRWREGPIGPPPRPPRVPLGRPTLLSVRPAAGGQVEGDVSRPRSVLGEPVVAQLRIRRDTPGALTALADGRYAVTGPLVVVGSRRDITQFATRRMRRLPAEDPERQWLQNVIGAMASDIPE